nr:cysteine-rich venom protein 6-like [Onthophagus taurus]
MDKSLAFVALFVISAAVVIAQTCGPNQVYNSCGSACPAYCNQEPGPCTLNCVAGCFCDEANNFTKRAIDAENDDCIQQSACPTCPGANEIYKVCGTRCQDYCGKPEGMVCPAICQEGCFCKDGFIRANDNVTVGCIPVEECP